MATTSSKLTMSQLAPFLEHLFATGEARLEGQPELGDQREAEAVLYRAFQRYRLDVAGPLIEFDATSGLAAANYLARACWYAVSRDDPPEVVTKQFPPVDAPSTASAHLSIDLTLRYVTTVYRRVQAQNAEDVLTGLIANTLRHCPLTGVLSDISDDPIADLSFAGHRGLQLLYAERLADRYRTNWLPPDGRAREVMELVFHQKDRPWLLKDPTRLRPEARLRTLP